MSKIGLFYGTDTGNTERVAEMIKDELGSDVVVEIHDIASASVADFAKYDKLILGHPTWYYGELQSSWEDFWDDFKTIDFTGKTFACFGLGDQADYSEYFLDAMGFMHDIALENGGIPAGYMSTEGFEWDESKALTEDEDFFVGLGIDEDQQPELTEARVVEWVQQIKEEMEL